MASSAKIISRTKKTAANKYGVERVPRIPANQACVLYLGGNLTEDDQAASGNAKIIEQEILPDVSRTVPVYSVEYDFDKDDLEFGWEYTFDKHGRSFMLSPRLGAFISLSKKNLNTEFRRKILPRLHHDGAPDIKYTLRNLQELYIAFDGDFDEMAEQLDAKFAQEMQKIGYGPRDIEMVQKVAHSHSIPASDLDFGHVNDIFKKAVLPRISAHNGTTKLNVQETMRRVRGLNIVAHCHGAYVALKIEEKMQSKMRELGYSDAEISKILSQLLIVAHAPAVPMGVSEARTISFMSANDYMLTKPKNWVRQYVMTRHAEEGDGKIGPNWMQPMFLSGKNGEAFVVHNAFNPDDFGAPRDDEHNNTHYTKVENQTQTGRLMGLIAGNIIRNGIENSLAKEGQRFKSLPPTHELIQGGADSRWMFGIFSIMQQNGRRFMRDVYRFATENMQLMHKVRGIDKNPGRVH